MSDMAFPLELFPTCLTLRRIDPSCNRHRYYTLSVQRDLFGNACLVREWGRIGTRGRIRIDRHLDEGSAVTALVKLSATKKRRGYSV
jgi:predicted DNA-binding WGR domain protein